MFPKFIGIGSAVAHGAAPGVWTICGLKARDMTAWGEAQRAKPQVKARTGNPLRAESAGHRVEMMPLFCFGLSGLGDREYSSSPRENCNRAAKKLR